MTTAPPPPGDTPPGATPTPDNSPPSKKGHTGLFIKSALVAVVFLMLAAAFLIGKLSNSPNNEGEPQSAATNSSTTSDTPQTPSPSGGYFEGKTAMWKLPVSPNGWGVKVFGDDGMYSYSHYESGCRISLRQSSGAQAAKTSGETPVTSIDNSFGQVAENASRFDVISTHTTKFTRSDGELVEFPAKTATYNFSDGPTENIEVGAQWFDDVELSYRIDCREGNRTQHQDSITNFLGQTAIVAV